ncbi:YceH family protein [Marinomonas sp. TW1]|uniref:YceH family protein n=1 Tax=Marinomonas sp. TW1 TaxID=1561203 RepID=UPI0007AF6C8C|nr:DUF480 domain-containing protein [Marinomonas sp. TW1]KZN12241.1 hypothetical protein OA79_17410 [Marinomonas sp. TW1]
MSYHEINFIEMRVIGCLIEKAITTPEYYPLSLNSLQTACNQKSNREPVMNLSEHEVQDAVDSLVERGLITEVAGGHSRVSKYQHRFCNTEFSDLKLNAAQTAVICLLFLRGPQTPGELRSRSGRLHDFESREEVEAALEALKNMVGGPYVEVLPKQAGKREARFQECFCMDSERVVAVSSKEDSYPLSNASLESRVNELESQVLSLMARIQALENASGL